MESPVSDAPKPLGRRERNKQKVKERLYSSALQLFAENGYEHTSIEEIAERADVARGTFFNYFQRKEDLIRAWGDRRREALMESISRAEPRGRGAVARLEQCMAILGSLNEEERESTAAMLMAWVKAGRPLLEEPYVGQIFAEIVEDGCREGEFRADLIPEHVGNVLRDVYLGILYRWSQRSPRDGYGSLHCELQEALKMLLLGIMESKASA
ncbi:TetR/AcrR family transcriptional regulator [Streptomyces sp. NPDC052109]|uniref:TetR/AcrR family transcriptional regulator n=1 Tax=Streptomyces sp. NPDC052109 TaxID=3155527 RepID=UPI003416E96F